MDHKANLKNLPVQGAKQTALGANFYEASSHRSTVSFWFNQEAEPTAKADSTVRSRSAAGLM